MNETLLVQLGITLLYAVVGTIVLVAVIYVIEAITEFSIKKEVIEDGNISVGIVLGAIIIALGMIISAAIH